MNIIVTGGAGYIGSHMVYRLIEEGHSVTIIDNLKNGYRELVHPKAELVIGDIRDVDLVANVITNNQIEALFHFAALVKVEESVSDPLKYYHNNTHGTACLLEAIKTTKKIKHFIFSSTAAVYGDSSAKLIDESHATLPINPYGHSKLMAEQILKDFAETLPQFHFCILRYFNVAGAHTNGIIGPRHQNATHLIKVAAEVASGKRDGLSIFGYDYSTPDGTCVRDYIHVLDLVEAHSLALRYLISGQASSTFNLGYGYGSSVKQVVETMGSVAGHGLKTHMTSRRPGDSASIVADSSKAKASLNWSPKWNDLRKICETAYQWEKTMMEEGVPTWNTAHF